MPAAGPTAATGNIHAGEAIARQMTVMTDICAVDGPPMYNRCDRRPWADTRSSRRRRVRRRLYGADARCAWLLPDRSGMAAAGPKVLIWRCWRLSSRSERRWHTRLADLECRRRARFRASPLRRSRQCSVAPEVVADGPIALARLIAAGWTSAVTPREPDSVVPASRSSERAELGRSDRSAA